MKNEQQKEAPKAAKAEKADALVVMPNSELDFGRVTLPYNTRKTPYIPHLLPYEQKGILEMLAFAAKANVPALLIGETGVGKTAGVRHLAAKTNNSLRRVNVNGSMTAEDFVGQLLVNEKGTYWKDGVLTEAMRNGYWILIDEINAASAEILFALHSLLDDDRYIVLTDHPEREIVRAHPDFRLFATMNPQERYAGTQAMNRALMSRFGLTLQMPLPLPEIEYGELSHADAKLPKEDAKRLKAFIEELRGSYVQEKIDVFVSPRDTAHIVRLYDFFKSVPDAIRHVLTPRGSQSEQLAIEKMVEIHFPKVRADGKPQEKEKRELSVGDKVRFTLDGKTPVKEQTTVFELGYKQLDVDEDEDLYRHGTDNIPEGTVGTIRGIVEDTDFVFVEYTNDDKQTMCLTFPRINLIAA